MNIAKRAIIVAAGFGSRLHPLTLDIPKPLLSVNGCRIIETILDALLQNGVNEIYIVVGYKKELFYSLLYKYPFLKFIENPLYDECNNISSLYFARDFIQDVIILDGDQIIHKPDILNPRFLQSCYCCSWTDSETREWLLQVEKGRVASCSRTGGKSGWQLYSISFWSQKDGALLQKHLAEDFLKPKNRSLYWDDIALFLHPEEYSLGIRKIADNDVYEIDTLEELIRYDSSYASLKNLSVEKKGVK